MKTLEVSLVGHFLWTALLFAMAALCSAAPSWGQVSGGRATAPFELHQFEFPGHIQGHLLRDVDGDGKLDILVVYGAPGDSEDHRLRVCLQVADKSFSSCSEFDLPNEARALDVGEVDGQPGAELLVPTDRDLRIAHWQSGKFGSLQTLSPLRTVFAGTDPNIPKAVEMLFDTDGDGRKEVVVPTLDGPVWIRAGQEPVVLRSPSEVTYRVGTRGGGEINSFLRDHYQSRVSTQHLTPDLFVEDFDGDGRLNIITLLGGELRVFGQTPEGDFRPEPIRVIERSILTGDELDGGFAGEAMTFSQLDGDGLADLIVMKWGSSEERTRMDRALYFSGKDGTYAEEPDQAVRSESVFPDFDVTDLNGDGRRDLVIPYFHFAPAQAVKVVTQNAIKIQFRLFLMRPDGRYDQGEGKDFARVDRRVVLDYHLDILKLVFGDSARPTGRIGPLLDFGGDFNGDGYADLAADDGANQLRIFWGNAEARYATSPDLEIPFESTLSYDLVDADGDGKTDVFAFHGTRPVGEELRDGRHHAVKRRRTEKQRARRDEARRARERKQEDEPPERVRLEILMSR